MIVFGSGVGNWVAHKLHTYYDERNSQALGWQRDGEITAGVIYEDWNQSTVVCHIAITNSLVKGYVWAIFDYPFRRLGVSKIICPVAEGNEESRKLVEKLGFQDEARIKDGHPSGDIIFYTLERDKCRWIKELENGKRRRRQ